MIHEVTRKKIEDCHWLWFSRRNRSAWQQQYV